MRQQRISVMTISTLALLVVLSVPKAVRAQEVGLAGTVTDSTDAVLPGVTVTAQHIDTGNTFVGVTDTAGLYRIGALRPGVYQIRAELSGFATIAQENVELLVGQRAVLNFKMTLSSVRESIIVTGQSPLIDVQQSKLGGNIDTRQMQELPLNGRNWIQLTMLAPGSRVNSVEDSPFGTIAGSFQVNLDGQQVTNSITFASIGQARFSRDAIAEFQLVSSRADATQGRSLGVQVNVVTKAGTNRYAGTVSGYFRDDALNAKDFIVNRVLPYSNQQVSTTFGGPIRRDKVHFFGYYEHEREPNAVTFTSPFARFNIPDLRFTRKQHLAGIRTDANLTADTRLMIRGNGWINDLPVSSEATSAANHPSTFISKKQTSGQLFASLIHSGGRSVNEVRGGVTFVNADFDNLVTGSTRIDLRGYSIGGGLNYNPLREYQTTYSVRDDFTAFRSRHELKLGGEFLLPVNYVYWSYARYGYLDATLGPIPRNIEDLFPVWNDPSTWNLAPLSSITRQYTKGIGNFEVHCASSPSCRHRKPEIGAWFQDNWQATSHLTLNLGVRWDFALDPMFNDLDLPPFRTPLPQEWWNFGPRLGLAYALPDTKTVIRGGWGLYFNGVSNPVVHVASLNITSVRPAVLNDGRSNFAADPFNILGGGHEPTFEEGLRQRHDLQLIPFGKLPYTRQTSIGLQRQFGQTTAVQADYIWVAGRREIKSRNINLSFNPATGANFPFSGDISKLPYPDFGRVPVWQTDGRSNYHGLETAFTKRFSDRWQATATYTLSGQWSYEPLPLNPGCAGPMNGFTMTCDTPFPVAADFGGFWALGAGSNQAPDQRHRAVFNGIWTLPYEFQASGLYFFASGQRRATSYGADLRDSGLSVNRLRPDGTIVPYYNFVGKPLHRVDLRLQRRFALPGGVNIYGMVEAFNLLNHANYGSYVTVEASPAYGRPVQNLEIAYQPRMVQLGFRVIF